ncbi:MAG: hypothetical protein WCT77_01975 [Bacteroidota bacterium]
MNLIQIRETGNSRTGTINATYDEVVAIVGKPNVTDIDDPDKVKASWGFQDKKTKRKGFIWSYKWYGDVTKCYVFSADGDASLLKELFGDKYI